MSSISFFFTSFKETPPINSFLLHINVEIETSFIVFGLHCLFEKFTKVIPTPHAVKLHCGDNTMVCNSHLDRLALNNPAWYFGVIGGMEDGSTVNRHGVILLGAV